MSTLGPGAYPNATLTPVAASGSGVAFSASAPVFSALTVGNIIRLGGGIATVTGYTDSQHVTGAWTLPCTQTIPGDPQNTPYPQSAGNWSILPQVTQITGLAHLGGKQVIGLADGIPVGPFTVSATGTVALPFAASRIVIGLAFLPQAQTVYLDPAEPTDQGRRKSISSASARLSASGFPRVLTNQPDGGALDPPQVAPTWLAGSLAKLAPVGSNPQNSPTYQTAAGQTVQPLATGDVYANLVSTWRKSGQVALQQPLALPLNLSAILPNYLEGDMPETTLSPRQGGRGQRQDNGRAVSASLGRRAA